VTLAGRTKSLELGKASFDTAHNVTLDGTIYLGYQEGLRKSSIEVSVEIGAVVLWEAFYIYLLNAVQVFIPEPSDTELFLIHF
jgi:hypothetical protein